MILLMASNYVFVSLPLFAMIIVVDASHVGVDLCMPSFWMCKKGAFDHWIAFTTFTTFFAAFAKRFAEICRRIRREIKSKAIKKDGLIFIFCFLKSYSFIGVWNE